MIQIPPQIHSLVRKIQRAGYKVYLVGGAVRDHLLGGSAAEFDLASSATPEEMMALFPRRAIPTGIAHGTVTIPCGPHIAEITTLRVEGAYRDGRHPEHVHFTSDIVEDLGRRDFTVNAVAYDLQEQTLIDPYDGRGDLARRIIRAVGIPKERFEEDALRLLRAVRFATQLQFTIEERTRAAIAPCAAQLSLLSAERIHGELDRILRSTHYRKGMLTLAELGLLEAIFGTLAASIQRSLENPLLRSERLLQPQTRFSSCFFAASGTAEERRKISKKLKDLRVPRKTIARVLALCEALSRTIQATMSAAALRRHLSLSGRSLIDDEIEMRRALGEKESLLSRMRREAAQPLQLGELAVSGTDLIEAFRIQGPRVGITLRRLLEKVIEDPGQNTKETLIALSKKILAEDSEDAEGV